MFGSLGVLFEKKTGFQKLENFWVAKAISHSQLNFELEFLNPLRTKSIQYNGLKFFGTVNRAVPFQYSELLFLQLHQKLYRFCLWGNYCKQGLSSLYLP